MITNYLREKVKKQVQSIKEMRCIKDYAGNYFYKGYEISKDGGTEYPWNYGMDIISEHSYAKTLKEAKQYVDYETQGMTVSEIKEQLKKELCYSEELKDLI